MNTEIFDEQGKYSLEERAMMREAGITVQKSPNPETVILQGREVAIDHSRGQVTRMMLEALSVFAHNPNASVVMYDDVNNGEPPTIFNK